MQDLQFALIRPPELILQDQLLDDNEKWDEIRQGLQQAGRKDEEIEQVHQNLIKSGKLQEPGFFGGIGNSIQDFLGANNASEENRQKVLKREEPEESYTDWLMNKAKATGEHLENAAIGIQNLPKSAKSTFLDLIEGGALRAKHDAYAVPNIFGDEDPTAPIKQKIEEKYGVGFTPPTTPDSEPAQQTPRPDVIPQDLSVAPEAMSPGELQQLGGKMMRGELTDEEKTRLKAYRNHLDLTSPAEIVPTKDQPKITADTFIDWTKEHRPKPLDPGLRLTIKSKLERKEPLSEEDYQALDEWKDQFPKPFEGDNTELGEVIQSLPSTALALGEGAIMATPGLLGRNPNAARAGMMYGSSDAASSMNVAGAVNEGRMFFKRNAPLGPEREQIQTLLYANYPQEDQLESLQRQMEKTITQKTNEYRWRYSSPFDMLSALPVGRGAKSMKDFLLRNISWDSATEGMTGAMDYMAQRWAIRDALKEALGDKISDDQALLFSKDEFLKSAALEAASGAIIAGPAAVGEYSIYGEDFKIAAEADRQRSQAKKVAKSDSGKQAEAESMQEYQQQILQAQEEAQANDGQQLLEAIKEEEAQEKAEAGILSGEKIEDAQDLDAMLEGGALESEEESEQILQGEQLQDTGETIAGEDSEVLEDALDLETAPPTKEEQDASILSGPPEASTDDDIQLLYDQQPAEQTEQQEGAEILTNQEELGGKKIKETEKLLQESTVPNQALTSRQRDEFRKALEEGKITVKGNAPLVRQAVQLLSRNNARLGLHMADGKIHVHDNVEQARKANPGMVIPEDAEAHIDPSTGHIHFIADQIQGSNVEQAALRAIRVAEHEFVGHKGLRDVFQDPKQLDTFLDRMYDIYHRDINQYRNAQDKLDATLPEGQRPPRMSDAVATEEWIVQRYAEMGQPVYDWQSKLARRFAGKSPQKMAHYELREIFDRIVRGQRHGAGDTSPPAGSASSPPESAVPSSTRRTKPEPPAVPPPPAVQGDADQPEDNEAPAVTPKPVQAPVEQPDPAPQVETPDAPPQPPPPPSETAPDYNPNELTMDFEAGLPKAKEDLQVKNPKPETPEAIQTPGVELEAAPTPEITAPETPDPQAPEPQAVEDMPEADAPEAEATEELVVQPPEVGEAPEVGSVVEKPTRDLNRDADELAPVRDTFNAYSSAQKEMAAQQFLTKTGKVGKDAREIRDAQTFEELSAKNQQRLAALLRDPNNKLPKVELPRSESQIDSVQVSPDAVKTESPESPPVDEPVRITGAYDAFKTNNAPYIIEERTNSYGGTYDKRVYTSEAYKDFMDTSDETNQRIRWGVRLSDGRTVSVEGAVRITKPEAYKKIKKNQKQAKKMGAIWKLMDTQEREAMRSQIPIETEILQMAIEEAEKTGKLWADKPTKEKLNVNRENYLHWATRKYLVDNQHPFAEVWSTAGVANAVNESELELRIMRLLKEDPQAQIDSGYQEETASDFQSEDEYLDAMDSELEREGRELGILPPEEAKRPIKVINPNFETPAPKQLEAPAATTATAPPEPADTSQGLPQPLAQSNKPAQLPADIAMATGDAEARLVLMDLPELSISHDLQGNENPDFVARGGVQPRNRVGISEDTKLQDIVTKPDAPRFLTNSVDPGVGAPIVNEQGAVLSGNNRSRALTYLSQQADRQDFWERYDLSLLEKAEELGFSKPTLTSTLQQAKAEGRRPVLVRQITTPLQEQQITAVAKLENVENVEAQSIQEQATEIANKMSSTDAANLITENGLAITRSSMAEKLRLLMGNPGDTKRYFNEDNSLTPEGERLISLAMLQRGYGDRLVNEVAQYRQQPAQIGALVQSAPSRIRMNEAIDALTSPEQQQALRELDLTDQWMDAIAMHDQAQDDLRVLPDFSNLEEVISFDNEITPMLIHSMRKGGRKASATAMRRMFDQYNNRVADSSTQLLATDPPNKTELVQEIFGDGQVQDTNQMTLFSRSPKIDTPAFRTWFNNSKVVNEDGDPLVLYHGSAVDNIEAFDPAKAGTILRSDWGPGIYFTPSEWMADGYRVGAVKETDTTDQQLYDAYEAEARRLGTTPMNAYIDLTDAGRTSSPDYDRLQNEFAQPWQENRRALDRTTAGRVYPVYVSLQNPLKYTYSGLTDEFLADRAKDKGHDGIMVYSEDGRLEEVVAFESTQIKSVDNKGSFNPQDPRIMYSRRGNLMAIHEMSASRLSGILRDGSLIAPSLAVTSKENPRTGFGDVSLLFDSSVVDPEQGGQTYSGDVYSRRMPKPIYALKPKEKRELAQQMAPKLEPLGFDQRDARYQMSMYLTPRDYIGGRSEAIMLALPDNWQTEYPDGNNMLPIIAKIDYLKEQGRLPELPQFDRNDPKNYNYASEVNQILNQAIVGQDYLYQAEGTSARADYDAWLGNYLDQFYQPFDAQFEDGWNSNSMRPKLKPWTPENVLKHMTGRIRNQESTMTHSIGQVKASSTRQFKSLDDIRGSEDRLVNEQQLEDHKDRTKTEDRLMDLGHELLNYHSYVSNTFAGLDEIHEAMSRYFRKTRNRKTEQPGLMGMALREQGYKDLPLDKVDEAVQLAREIREAPVKYFESKPQRLVNTREIEAVVAPPNALSAANVQELERLGIPLVEYDPNIDGDREAKMREAAEQQDVLFSRKKPVALTPQQLQGLPARLNANAILDGQEVPNIEGGSYTRSLGLTPANKKVQNMDIAHYLDNRSRSALGVDGPVEETEELYEAVALTMNEEINRQLREDSSGSGWYDRAMADAMGMYTVLHPELATNPDASMIFKSLLAITSQGETVFNNGQLADGLYSEYKKTGRIPQTVDALKKAAMEKNLQLLQVLLDTYGPAKLNQFFNTPMSVRDINKVRETYNMGEIDELADTMLVGSAVFGPKIGVFNGNLNRNFDLLTIDIWMNRTLSRYFGEIVTFSPEKDARYRQELNALWDNQPFEPSASVKKRPKQNKLINRWAKETLNYYAAGVPTGKIKANGKPEKRSFHPDRKTDQSQKAKHIIENLFETNDKPTNANRVRARDLVQRVHRIRQKNGESALNTADLQAVLWYYEKHLFRTLGGGSKTSAEADYVDAAHSIIDQGENGEQQSSAQNIRARRSSGQFGDLAALRQQLPQVRGTGQVGGGTGAGSDRIRNTDDQGSSRSEQPNETDPGQAGGASLFSRSPEFRSWFGNSQAVDADGNPLVLYHGTGSDIEAFDLDIAQDQEGRRYFLGLGAGKLYLTGEAEIANLWAKNSQERRVGKSPNVLPLYVRLENPITGEEYHRRYRELNGTEMNDEFQSQRQRDRRIQKLDSILKEEGVDGIWDVYYNPDGSISEVIEAAVFDPTQIKSIYNETPTNTDNRLLYSRNPNDLKQERIQLIEQLRQGQITNEQYDQWIDENDPIMTLGEKYGIEEGVPTPATDTEIEAHTGGIKNPGKAIGKVLDKDVFLEDGDLVANRLDIPAYTDHDSWVVTLHDGSSKGGKALAYGAAARIQGHPKLNGRVEFATVPKQAFRIAGGGGKSTIARMRGGYVNQDRDSLAAEAQRIIREKDPAWIEVGMNPYRASYFYDKATGTPVNTASEVIQVGALVLAKDPEYGTRSDYSFVDSTTGRTIQFSRRLPNRQELAQRAMAPFRLIEQMLDPLGRVEDRTELLSIFSLAKGEIERTQRIARKVRKNLDKAKNKEEVYEYLTNRVSPQTITNEVDRLAAMETKGLLNEFGQRLVDAGRISQESYDKYKDQYLPQVYLAHLTDDFSFLSTGRKPSPMGYTKERKLDDSEPEHALIKSLLGEIKNPAYLAGRSLSTVGRDLALLEMMEAIHLNPNWALADQFAGWSYHDEMEDIINSLGLSDSLRQQFKLNQIKPAPQFMNMIPAVDQVIGRLETDIDEAVKTQQQQVKEVALYTKRILAGFRNRLQDALPNQGRPHLEAPKLKRAANQVDKLFDLMAGVELPATDNQHLAAQYLESLLQDPAIAGVVQRLGQASKEVSQMRGKSVTSTYLQDEADRLRQQVIPQADGEYKQALEEMTRRMDQLIAQVHRPNTLFKADTWKRMPASARYGALRNMIVHKDIYDTVVGVTQMSEADPTFWDKWIAGDHSVANQYQQFQKLMSVPANIPAVARNFISNKIWMYVITGMGPIDIPRYWLKAVNEMRKPVEDSRYRQVAEKYGLGMGTFSNAELNLLTNELKAWQRDVEAEAQGRGVIGKITRNSLGRALDFGRFLGTWVGDQYQAVESLDKMAVMMYSMEQKGMSDAEAVQEAEDALFDYSMVRPSVRQIRTSIIGAPFITYSLKVAETLARRFQKEPVKISMRMLPILAAQYGMVSSVVKFFQDLEEDDWDEIGQEYTKLFEKGYEFYQRDDIAELKRNTGYWMENNPAVVYWPFKDSNGKWQLYNTGYLIPWSMYTNMMQYLFEGKPFEAIGEAGLGQSFIPQIVMGLVTGVDPFTGQPIMDDHLSLNDQEVQKYVWATNQLTPGMFRGLLDMVPKYAANAITGDNYNVPSRAGQGLIRQLLDAAAQEDMIPYLYGDSSITDSRGNLKRTLGQSAARAFGQNLYSVDPLYNQSRALPWKKGDLDRLKQQANRELKQIMGNKGMSEKQRLQRYQERYQYWFGEGGALGRTMKELERVAKPIPPELLVQ